VFSLFYGHFSLFFLSVFWCFTLIIRQETTKMQSRKKGGVEMNRSERIEIQRHLKSGLDIRDVPYLVRVQPIKPPEAVWCNGRLISIE
jgi:hypothetical protein